MRAIFDWAVLNDILGDQKTVSEAKVRVYEQHKRDLAFLKAFIRRHKPQLYGEVLRVVDGKKSNYAAYSGHADARQSQHLKKKGKEDFSKELLKTVKDIEPAPEEAEAFDDMLRRLELRTFLPKQRDPDNRVIPHQLYLYEMKRLLNNAAA